MYYILGVMQRAADTYKQVYRLIVNEVSYDMYPVTAVAPGREVACYTWDVNNSVLLAWTSRNPASWHAVGHNLASVVVSPLVDGVIVATGPGDVNPYDVDCGMQFLVEDTPLNRELIVCGGVTRQVAVRGAAAEVVPVNLVFGETPLALLAIDRIAPRARSQRLATHIRHMYTTDQAVRFAFEPVRDNRGIFTATALGANMVALAVDATPFTDGVIRTVRRIAFPLVTLCSREESPDAVQGAREAYIVLHNSRAYDKPDDAYVTADLVPVVRTETGAPVLTRGAVLAASAAVAAEAAAAAVAAAASVSAAASVAAAASAAAPAVPLTARPVEREPGRSRVRSSSVSSARRRSPQASARQSVAADEEAEEADEEEEDEAAEETGGGGGAGGSDAALAEMVRAGVPPALDGNVLMATPGYFHRRGEHTTQRRALVSLWNTATGKPAQMTLEAATRVLVNASRAQAWLATDAVPKWINDLVDVAKTGGADRAVEHLRVAIAASTGARAAGSAGAAGSHVVVEPVVAPPTRTSRPPPLAPMIPRTLAKSVISGYGGPFAARGSTATDALEVLFVAATRRDGMSVTATERDAARTLAVASGTIPSTAPAWVRDLAVRVAAGPDTAAKVESALRPLRAAWEHANGSLG
jgi:hypothetical protein